MYSTCQNLDWLSLHDCRWKSLSLGSLSHRTHWNVVLWRAIVASLLSYYWTLAAAGHAGSSALMRHTCHKRGSNFKVDWLRTVWHYTKRFMRSIFPDAATIMSWLLDRSYDINMAWDHHSDIAHWRGVTSCAPPWPSMLCRWSISNRRFSRIWEVSRWIFNEVNSWTFRLGLIWAGNSIGKWMKELVHAAILSCFANWFLLEPKALVKYLNHSS